MVRLFLLTKHAVRLQWHRRFSRTTRAVVTDLIMAKAWMLAAQEELHQHLFTFTFTAAWTAGELRCWTLCSPCRACASAGS